MADQVMTSLVQAIDGLVVRLLHHPSLAPGSHGALVVEPRGTARFQRGARMRAQGYRRVQGRGALCPARSIPMRCLRIAQGRLPTRLALTWNDRDGVGADGITANQEAGISGQRLPKASAPARSRRMNSTHQRSHAATGELRQLLPALIEALGGKK